MSMTKEEWPDRIRLHGGRNIHAARHGTTPCGYHIGPADERLPDDTEVTCRRCMREMAK